MSSHPLLVEVEAPGLDEAVSLALAWLGCRRTDADPDVLRPPGRGLFNRFGRKPARVRSSPTDLGLIARTLLRRMFDLTGFVVRIVRVAPRRETVLQRHRDLPGLLLGRYGQPLDVMPSLVSGKTARLTTDRTPLSLDVEGCRPRREAFLRRLASPLFRQLRRTRQPLSTPALNPGERRHVYDPARTEADLAARSQSDDGDPRVVVLSPGR